MIKIIDTQEKTECVNVKDRAFNYGDGFFTTILVKQGRAQLLSYHLERFRHASKILAITLNEFDAIFEQVRQLAEDIEIGVIKVHVSRGTGGRGYGTKSISEATITITTTPYPEDYHQWQQNGIVLAVAQYKLGHNPNLAGVKHLNRLEQVLIKREIEQTSYDDALVLDISGNIIETSAANVFWLREGKWSTPALDLAGVNGVMRQHIMDKLKRVNQVNIVSVPLCEILEAEAVFMCNALMEIVPVVSIRDDENGRTSEFNIEEVHLLQQVVGING